MIALSAVLMVAMVPLARILPDDGRWWQVAGLIAFIAAGCAALLAASSRNSRFGRALMIVYATFLFLGAAAVMALLVGGWPFWVGVAGATQNPAVAERQLTEALRRADSPGSATLPRFYLRITANGIIPADRPLILVELAVAQNHAGHREACLRSLREAQVLYQEQDRVHEANMVTDMLRRTE